MISDSTNGNQVVQIVRGLMAESLAEFIQGTSGLECSVARKSRASYLFFGAAALLLLAATGQKFVSFDQLLGFFYFSKLWAMLAIVRIYGG